MDQFRHESVLLNEVVELVSQASSFKVGSSGSNAESQIIIDGTFGGGGHSRALIHAIPSCQILGIDRDTDAVSRGLEKFKHEILNGRLKIVHGRFSNCLEIMKKYEPSFSGVDGIILDLGVSSYQLDTPNRGFSFSKSGKLDMRMDAADTSTHSAFDLVAKISEQDLTSILFEYGEERLARKIARMIVDERKRKPIESTEELARIVEKAYPPPYRRKEKIHPATRTFQALRIAINEELSELELALKNATLLLKPGGRIAIISFHSLEDRIVKHFFREISKDCKCPPEFPRCVCGGMPDFEVITKKPILPTEDEMVRNPRSRSAKLRCLERRVDYEKSKEHPFG